MSAPLPGIRLLCGRLIPPVTIVARAGEREFKRNSYGGFINRLRLSNPTFIGVRTFGNLTKELNLSYVELYHLDELALVSTN